MVQFKEINEDNFRAIIRMKQPEDQHFVAPNMYSLAEAWLYRENNDLFPFAIYDEEELVGFIMVQHDEEEKVLSIWRLMIAVEHQGKGYGTAALQLVIDEARKSGRFERLALNYVPENVVGEHVYRKVGLRPTGEIEEGEIVMEMVL